MVSRELGVKASPINLFILCLTHTRLSGFFKCHKFITIQSQYDHGNRTD